MRLCRNLRHSIIFKKRNFEYLDKNVENILSLKSPYIEKAILDSCKIKRNSQKERMKII